MTSSITLVEQRKENKRSQARRDRQAKMRRYTRCPGCGEYMGWWYTSGLKGKLCNCGWLYSGSERNPLPTHCVSPEGIVHYVYKATRARGPVRPLCHTWLHTGNDGLWGKVFAERDTDLPPCKPAPVTCLDCLAGEP